MRVFVFFFCTFFCLVSLYAETGTMPPEKKEMPVTHHGFLAPKPNFDTEQILDKARSVLDEKEVAGDSYDIKYINESNSIFIKATDEQIKKQVWDTINDVVNWQYQSSYTEVISLQYGDAKEIAGILSNIYSPKMYQKLPDGRHVIKKSDNNIDISPDTRTNSLIVTAPRGVIESIRETVQKLDRRTMQVVIKVLIAEITLNEDTQFGIEWFYGDSKFFSHEKTQPEARVDFGNTCQDKKDDLLGLKYSILRGPEERLRAFIQTLESTSKINVLSSPQLLTSNNNQAQFEETLQVPIAKVTTTATDTTRNIDYQDIGIKLTVTPQINIDDYIKLDIEQTIQNIVESSTVLDAPTYSNRVVKTDVLVKDGHTVIIGGLMKDEETIRKKKVPLLGDLPLIKDLFRRDTRTTVKTELMVFITPQIIQEEKTMKKVVSDLHTPQLKEKLSSVKKGYVEHSKQEKNMKDMLVLEVAGDKVLINRGRKQGIKLNNEFEIVRHDKAHYHPETHQLISMEDKKIATVKVEIVKETTCIARVLSVEKDQHIYPRDLVRRPKSGMDFSDMEISMISINFNWDAFGGFAVDGYLNMKNVTSLPLLKTEIVETPIVKNVKCFLVSEDEEIPLKVVKKPGFTDRFSASVFFPRMIDPEEEIRIKMIYEMKEAKDISAKFIGLLRKFAREKDFYYDVFYNTGPSSENCQIQFTVNLPGKISYKEFNYEPVYLEHDDGSSSLIWTQIGSPLRINGKIRYSEPEEILMKLLQ